MKEENGPEATNVLNRNFSVSQEVKYFKRNGCDMGNLANHWSRKRGNSFIRSVRILSKLSSWRHGGYLLITILKGIHKVK